MENGLRIGLFDSGVGGLSVLDACIRAGVRADYYYYGDNARAPYGDRSEEEIAAFTEEGLSKLRECGIHIAILACNTATAVCIGKMREKFSFPIVGTEPSVRLAASFCRSVLVLATPRTAESERLHARIASCPQCRFQVHAAPHLAAAIEGKLLRGEPLDLSRHLPAFFGDGVVLGCTHYSLIKREIAQFYGLPVFDSGFGVARRVLFLENVGMNFHFRPRLNFRKKWSKKGKSVITFLGSGKYSNKRLWYTNECFSFR